MSEIVVSSRVRLARNYEDLPFRNKISREQSEDCVQRTLDALEKGEVPQVLRSPKKTKAGTVEDGAVQLSFFQLDDPTLSAIRDYLKDADLNNMTPMQAFDLLRKMKGELGL